MQILCCVVCVFVELTLIKCTIDVHTAYVQCSFSVSCMATVIPIKKQRKNTSTLWHLSGSDDFIVCCCCCENYKLVQDNLECTFAHRKIECSRTISHCSSRWLFVVFFFKLPKVNAHHDKRKVLSWKIRRLPILMDSFVSWSTILNWNRAQKHYVEWADISNMWMTY